MTSSRAPGADSRDATHYMSVLVVGSVAFDDIKTPHGSVTRTLGGSAAYFALASCLFVETKLVSVVGGDFPAQYRDLLAGRGIDLEGLTTVGAGRTFHWSGEYSPDMNRRETLSVALNVLDGYHPVLPAGYAECPYVFLANGDPTTQMEVLDQVRGNPFVMADTMDLWIRTRRGDVEKLLERIDGLVLNDSEATLFTDETNLVAAGRRIRRFGPRFVVIKKGEHGALIFHDGGEVYLPASPLAEVKDPTGAGDSFAGGLMGHLAQCARHDLPSLKLAVAWGTVAASFCCQGFGVERLERLTRADLDDRHRHYVEMLTLRA